MIRTSHVLHYRRGNLIRSGRGLAFWFLPLSASLAEIPCDDRDEPFLFHGRSRDFQDVTAQGTITYRILEPELTAPRVDFTIDPKSGRYLKTPLEQLSELLSQSAQQLAWDYMTATPLRQLLAEGVDEIRRRIRDGLNGDESLAEMGLQIVSVRVAAVSPTAELEKALQAPAREAIQEQADEAVFQRRALAVEKERAIAENELQNRIELARREEDLIEQQGQNRRREESEEAEADRIRAEAAAQRRRLRAATQAEGIRVVEKARVESDAERMDVYRTVPSQVMLGLAAQELAGNLTHIDHLNLGGDSLTPLLSNLIQSGIRQLEGNGRPVATVSETQTETLDPSEEIEPDDEDLETEFREASDEAEDTEE